MTHFLCMALLTVTFFYLESNMLFLLSFCSVLVYVSTRPQTGSAAVCKISGRWDGVLTVTRDTGVST